MHMQTRNTTVSLAFMGAGWQDAGITFRALRFADLATITGDASGAAVLTLLKDVFISGKALDTDGQLTDMVADDLEQLDLESFKEISGQIIGGPDPKASPSSTASSTPENQPLGAISA